MPVKLPQIIKQYVDASNEHDVKSILSCFSEKAIVRDEREEHRGKKAIESWSEKTIQKYKFHFKPLGIKKETVGIVVGMEVSGTFPGSPVSIHYRFTIQNEKILSLAIN